MFYGPTFFFFFGGGTIQAITANKERMSFTLRVVIYFLSYKIHIALNSICLRNAFCATRIISDLCSLLLVLRVLQTDLTVTSDHALSSVPVFSLPGMSSHCHFSKFYSLLITSLFSMHFPTCLQHKIIIP